MATHSTLTKSTKPFISGYPVIVIVLLSSVPGKACLSVCSVAILASPKLEARELIKQWRKEYNQVRPHSALNYRPPAPDTNLTMATT